jgi:hypothetical protein
MNLKQLQKEVWQNKINKGFNITNVENNTTIFKDTYDIDIIKIVIGEYNKMFANLYGISEYGLDLCSPSTSACSILEYKSPLIKSDSISEIVTTTSITQQPIIKTKFNIVGLSTPIIIKAKQNLPDFTIYITSTQSNTTLVENETIENVNTLNNLDDSYIENLYNGNEENAQ